MDETAVVDATGTAAAEVDGEAMQFMGRVANDFGAMAAVLLWALADELGLLTALARGAASAADAASSAGRVDPRSAAEILAGLACAGYLVQDNGSFRVPAENAAVLLDGTALSCAGGALEVSAIARMWPQVIDACRTGAGINPAVYARQFHLGMERLSAPVYTQQLPDEGLAQIPGLVERLTAGATVADIGCGHGVALSAIAAKFVAVRGTGYDVDEQALTVARRIAEQQELGDRVAFHCHDVAVGLPEQYDLVLAFDVLHDAGDPAGVAGALRRATREDGVLLVLEPASADNPADNAGPIATLLHLFSVGYCLPVATHNGRARLGTAGLPPARLQDLLTTAGYSSFRQVPWQAGFNAMYEARP